MYFPACHVSLRVNGENMIWMHVDLENLSILSRKFTNLKCRTDLFRDSYPNPIPIIRFRDVAT